MYVDMLDIDDGAFIVQRPNFTGGTLTVKVKSAVLPPHPHLPFPSLPDSFRRYPHSDHTSVQCKQPHRLKPSFNFQVACTARSILTLLPSRHRYDCSRYHTLDGGNIGEALLDLTGSPVTDVNLDNDASRAQIKSGQLWKQLQASTNVHCIAAPPKTSICHALPQEKRQRTRCILCMLWSIYI